MDTNIQNQTLVSKIRPLCLKYYRTVYKQTPVLKIRHKNLKWDTSVQNKKLTSKEKKIP